MCKANYIKFLVFGVCQYVLYYALIFISALCMVMKTSHFYLTTCSLFYILSEIGSRFGEGIITDLDNKNLDI